MSCHRPRPRKYQDFIIDTNNNSIVSKRSVERLYFLDEPHYFRYFVKKPKRRNPLINRGYWLRIKAIDHIVCKFLSQNSSKRKIVINLGCGYDPLPWQCFSKYPDVCKKAIFIDIDFRDLILRKRKLVQDVPDLNSDLTNIETSDEFVLLRSDQYLQVGCDLSNIAQLNDILSDIVDEADSSILFIAEVSITYMEADAADKLIRWASHYLDAQFCLLEQLLPDGIENPFAQTMMAHFEKLKSPLCSVKNYPTKSAQKDRFKFLGWGEVYVQNLWELWSSDDFLTPGQRIALDVIEPFDEWEEFSLFGSHYVLLLAMSKYSCWRLVKPLKSQMMRENMPFDSLILKKTHIPYQKPHGSRRFAAPFLVKSPDRTRDRIAVFGGLGTSTRLNSRDEYSSIDQDIIGTNYCSSASPSSRMCHTITDLGDMGAILVGGRKSPGVGLHDCWIYHKFLDIWERVDDLPWPLYRHQSIRIGSNSVLVSIGRVDNCGLSDYFLKWNRRTGWVKCIYSGTIPCLVYSPVFFKILSREDKIHSGILAGGMNLEGVVMNKVWRWELKDEITVHPTIQFTESILHPKLCRFGACTVTHLGRIYLFGGIIKNELLTIDDEICCIEATEETLQISQVKSSIEYCPRYLFIGISIVSIDENIVVMGGSTVCFSFGTFWNPGCLTLSLSNNKKHEEWRFLGTVEAGHTVGDLKPTSKENSNSLYIPRIKLISETHFFEILNAEKPAIFEGLDIGSCTAKWNPEYLKKNIGEDRDLTIHQASTEYMDFNSKNFNYTSMKFGEFISQIDKGAKLYLRSLSSDNPAQLPADLSKDFPRICSDFCLPEELSFVKQNSHSSPLRISGPVIMWLHYDTLANVLCQIQGEKEILLFHPSEFKYFDIKPGKSSSSINVFESIRRLDHKRFPRPYEALLKPGDVIYIPPFWLHTLSSKKGISVAVNVFFKNLSKGYTNGKDVYGNRDLYAYEKSRQDISKILASFDSTPSVARDFYLQRLIEELKQEVLQSGC
ncbi:putative leucine carboxyl methyltransferase [Erysiphe necator]|uniref:tRNA wybutosine-synthesizing protein 4 n=1 Tax=Uncinula necator TaxID=52586 RepID=A0A0B1PAM6_UNCNE|nr:putative leucine carboxyl methyltransferase [Erysiphe necator]